MPDKSTFNYTYNNIALLSPDDATLILDIERIDSSITSLWKNDKSSEYIILECNLNEILHNKQDKKDIIKYLLNSLYINGILIKNQVQNNIVYALIKKTNIKYPIIYNLYINEPNYNYEFSFNIKVYTGNLNKQNIPVSNTPKNIFTIDIWHTSEVIEPTLYSKHGNHIGEYNKTCMLLRTNPLLTGNIRLVIEDDTLYLDTFRKYSQLSGDYQKRPVATNGNYAYDINKIFGKVDQNQLYNLAEPFYKVTKNQDYKNQYIDSYDYGAVENTDDLLYHSSLKILAPLFIENNIPDYFVIFRNELSDKTKTKDNFINDNTKVIKIIDLRKHTKIGEYLYNWADECSQYAYRNIKYNPSKTDSYFGIDYTSGIINDKQNGYTTKQNRNIINTANILASNQLIYRALTLQNQYNLIHPNILNLEFMFDDPNAVSFKLYNYFGLYLTENQIFNINKIEKVKNSYNLYDSDNKQKDINEIYSLIQNSKLSTRIFALSNNKNVSIVKTQDDVLSYLNTYINNKPGKLIGGVQITDKEIQESTESFITINFDREIHPGEHFRIIKPVSQNYDIKNACIVYELIASSDSRLLRYNTPIGHYIETNQIGDIKIYSIPFYVNDKQDNNKLASLDEQLKRFNKALYKFNDIVKLQHISNKAIAIYTNESNLYFQHILEPNITDEYDYIHYYNPYYKSKVTNNHIFDTTKYYAFNNPITEVNSIRLSNIVAFIKSDIFKNQLIYEIDNTFNYELSGITIPKYKASDNKFYSLNNININDNVLGNSQYNKLYAITSPYNTNKSIILVDAPILSQNNEANLYYSPEFNFCVMGIIGVKDIISDDNESNTKDKSWGFSKAYQQYHQNKSLLLEKTYKISYDVIIEKGTVIDLRKLKNIQFFTLYSITESLLSSRAMLYSTIHESGTFNFGGSELQTGTLLFFINHDYLLYKKPDMKSFQLFQYHSEKDNKQLTAISTIYLSKKEIIKNPNDTEYTISYPKTSLDWIIDNKVDNKLRIPIVPNLNVQYDKTYVDTYFSKDGRECITESNNIQPYYNVYVSNPDITSEHGYVKYSLNDRIKFNDNILTVRDYILSGAENALTLLYKKYLKTSTVYFKDKQAEFIYNNIKFQMQFSTDDIFADLDVTFWDLDGYEAILIFDADPNRDTEIFISYNERLILIVEHKTNQYNSKYRTFRIKNIQNNSVATPGYYWYNAPYYYEFINAISCDNNSTLLHKHYNDNIYNNSFNDVYNIIQAGYPIYNHIADFSETGYMCSIIYDNTNKNITQDNEIIQNNNIFLSENLLYNQQYSITSNISSNTFYQYFLYASRYNEKHPEYIYNTNDLDGLIYDIVDKTDKREYHSYLLRTTDNDIEITALSDILNVLNTNSYILHYIQNGASHTVNINDVYNAMTLKASEKQQNDDNNYYVLHKEDIIEFAQDDNILSELTKIDFTHANTQITNIKQIQRTINSIDDNTLYYRVKHNLFDTPWNTSVIYKNAKLSTPVKNKGYWPKMFMGSCCMNIDKAYQINLNISSSQITIDKKNNILSLNLNQIFKSSVKENDNLKNNWNAYLKDTKNSEDITNYINQSLVSRYNCKQADIKFLDKNNKEVNVISKSEYNWNDNKYSSYHITDIHTVSITFHSNNS